MKTSLFNSSIQFATDVRWRSWIILGPLFLALTLVLAVHISDFTFLAIPLIALSGIVMIHLWQWRGFFATVVLMTLACVYLLLTDHQHIWIWNGVLAAASLCSLAVARLGYDEAETFLSNFFRDAEREKKALQEVTTAKLRSDASLNEQILTLNQAIEGLNVELLRREEALGVKEHLLGLTRDEVGAIDTERQRLMRIVLDLQAQSSDRQHKLEALELQIEEKNEQHAIVHELTDYVASLEKEKQETKTAIQALIAEKTEQQAMSEKLSFAIETLELERRQIHKALQKQMEEKAECQTAALKLSEEIQALQQEKEQLNAESSESREVRRLQGFQKQLKEQFDQKSRVLDETRKELFLAQEKGEALRRELESAELSGNQGPDHFSRELLEEALKEIEMLEKRHDDEVLRLQAIIDSLMTS